MALRHGLLITTGAAFKVRRQFGNARQRRPAELAELERQRSGDLIAAPRPGGCAAVSPVDVKACPSSIAVPRASAASLSRSTFLDCKTPTTAQSDGRGRKPLQPPPKNVQRKKKQRKNTHTKKTRNVKKLGKQGRLIRTVLCVPQQHDDSPNKNTFASATAARAPPSPRLACERTAARAWRCVAAAGQVQAATQS